MAVADADALHRLPDTIEFPDAVDMVGTGRTAMAILDVAEIIGDDVVLITAAAGGVGSLLVQAAKHRGATVVGLAGGAAKVRVVEELGADRCFDYTEPGWPSLVQASLGDRSITVALDGVGGAIGREVLDLVGPGGRLVIFGYSSGEVLPMSAAERDGAAKATDRSPMRSERANEGRLGGLLERQGA
jgi:NADPH2:quinone reductase